MNRRLFFLMFVAMLIAAKRPGAQQTAVLPANAEEADFAQLHHYREANQMASAGSTRVVFLGDSITEYWGLHSGIWFSNVGWVNRGIGGQTTQQLLLRERADALALHPKAVVLEGAGNDMRLGFSPEQIRDNLTSMGEVAQVHGIKVFIPAMTPVCDCVRPLTGLRTVERIKRLNGMLQDLCREKHWNYMDFNGPLAGPDGVMRKELTVDGVHPNDAGYEKLATVVLAALHDFR